MSQRKTKGNPNFGRKDNAPTLAVNNSTLVANTPTMAANLPYSATAAATTPMSSTPEVTSPKTHANVAIPKSSNLLDTPMEVAKKEDFGRDKDLNTLLKHLQPKAFKGEGADIPKILEEWIISMDDYFALANYNSIAQGIMGKAKLEGSGKLWWKLHSQQTQGKAKNSVGWIELKKNLREWYLPLNYSTVKMNEFLSCVKKGGAIDNYYEKFVKLSRHAPLMTEEQKLCRFILGLEGTLIEEVNAL